MKKLSFISIFVLLLSSSLFAQPPSIEWSLSIGGNSIDVPNDVRQTADSGYIVTGWSEVIDNDPAVYCNNQFDFWIVRLDKNGGVLWQSCFGGSGFDEPKSIIETQDGGFMVAGSAQSNDYDVLANYGDFDVWLTKLDSNGVMEWSKNYGGSARDGAYSILQLLDGSYIFTGESASSDFDVSSSHGYSDFWVVKISNTGSIIWEKTYGGSDVDIAFGIEEGINGNFFVVGYTYSSDGDVSNNPHSSSSWIIKIDSLGTLLWEKSIQGESFDIDKTSDGGCVVTGEWMSIIKLDSNGNVLWQNSFGGSGGYSFASSVIQTTDGGYVLFGKTAATSGDVSNNYGGFDVWLIKLNSSGGLQWEKTYGGTSHDGGNAIRQTFDDGFILACTSQSADHDLMANLGMDDFWIVKLSASLGLDENFELNALNLFPNPTTGLLTIESNLKYNQIQIIDVSGKLVLQLGYKKNIDVTSISKGLYFIKLISEDGIVTKPFVKE